MNLLPLRKCGLRLYILEECSAHSLDRYGCDKLCLKILQQYCYLSNVLEVDYKFLSRVLLSCAYKNASLLPRVHMARDRNGYNVNFDLYADFNPAVTLT